MRDLLWETPDGVSVVNFHNEDMLLDVNKSPNNRGIAAETSSWQIQQNYAGEFLLTDEFLLDCDCNAAKKIRRRLQPTQEQLLSKKEKAKRMNPFRMNALMSEVSWDHPIE